MCSFKKTTFQSKLKLQKVCYICKQVQHTHMSSTATLETLLRDPSLSKPLRDIAEKVAQQQRITPEEGVLLFEEAELAYLGILANYIREQKQGDNTYFNRNFHIEPTNLCVYTCKFCSYSRLINRRHEGWEYTMEDM